MLLSFLMAVSVFMLDKNIIYTIVSIMFPFVFILFLMQSKLLI